MSKKKIHVGDEKTVLRALITDDVTGLFVDISSATTKTIKLQKTDGTVVEKTAVFTTDGTDGYIQYITVTGDIDQAGGWKIQGFVDGPNFRNHSTIKSFLVYENLS